MTITLEEAQARLSELVDLLAPGEELVITRGSAPVARLIGTPQTQAQPVLGRGKGKYIIVSETDDHLDDFAEYME